MLTFFSTKTGCFPMGVIYCIFPLDAGIADYLRELGVAVPTHDDPTRNPTPREVREVCNALTDCSVELFSRPDHAWQMNIGGRRDPEQEPWTVLHVPDFNGREDDPHSIWFEKGWPCLIMRIVNGLTRKCGPLVIWPDTGEAPVAVSSDESIEESLQSWEHTRDPD